MAPNLLSSIGMIIMCHHHNIPDVVEVVYSLFSRERFRGTQVLCREGQRIEPIEASSSMNESKSNRSKRREEDLAWIYLGRREECKRFHIPPVRLQNIPSKYPDHVARQQSIFCVEFQQVPVM